MALWVRQVLLPQQMALKEAELEKPIKVLKRD